MTLYHQICVRFFLAFVLTLFAMIHSGWEIRFSGIHKQNIQISLKITYKSFKMVISVYMTVNWNALFFSYRYIQRRSYKKTQALRGYAHRVPFFRGTYLVGRSDSFNEFIAYYNNVNFVCQNGIIYIFIFPFKNILSKIIISC